MAKVERQGPDLSDRAGQRRGPPPPGPLPPPLQGHVPRPSHGRRGAQAALPPAATRELPADARQLPIYLRLSVSNSVWSIIVFSICNLIGKNTFFIHSTQAFLSSSEA